MPDLWRLLERPGLAPVWRRLHDRMERDAAVKVVTLTGLSDEARSHLQGLFGSARRPPQRFRLDLGTLDAALASVEPDLTARAVVERLVGPVVDRRDAKAQRAARDATLWASARTTLPGHLDPWLAHLQTQGLLKRQARTADQAPEALLAQAIRCARALPADGVLLQVLAAEATGDPHALDPGRPLSVLLLHAARTLVGWTDWPRSTAARRALWAEVGVLHEGLSSHVLVHGLRPLGEGLLARQLRDQSDAGRPRKITLDELRNERLRFAPQPTFIAENPCVIDEAARRNARRCRPLVCIEGEPSVAAWRLLRALADSGCSLHFQCDFDPAGLRIGNRLFHRIGATPWRFTAAEYRAAARTKAVHAAFEGTVVETPWDRNLAPAMRAMGQAVYEEDVLERLVADLNEASLELVE